MRNYRKVLTVPSDRTQNWNDVYRFKKKLQICKNNEGFVLVIAA